MMASFLTQRAFSAGSEFPASTPGRLRLYSMRFCPYAQRARLVLAHKNIEHETVNIDLGSKPDWFLVRNPFGMVPVLELEDQVLYESTVTCDWLDDVYPQNRLTPSDPYKKAKDSMLLEYYGRVTSCYYGILFKNGDIEKMVSDMEKHYKFYEDVLAERGTPYFGGDQPAMIDFFIWPHMERVPDVLAVWEPRCAISKDKYPYLSAWFDVMYQLPAVKATICDKETHQQFAKTYFTKAKTDYDFKLLE